MSDKKIVVVFGATGTTGGSVANYLLEDGTFAVRAITRNASSPAAQELKAKGAEIVEADLGKTETLPAALKGAYAVSGLTDFWAIFPTVGMDAEKAQAEEERQGYALVDAAKAAGIEHFVWFDLWEEGGVPHFVGKNKIAKHLERSGVGYTILKNAFYFENVYKFGMFKKLDDGTLELNMQGPADMHYPSYSAEQSGGWVLALLKNPQEYKGKTKIAVSQHATPRQYKAGLEKALGKPVKLVEISKEEFLASGKTDNPFFKELWLNMKAFYDYCQPPNSIYGKEEDSLKIYPGAHDLDQFLAKNQGFAAFAKAL